MIFLALMLFLAGQQPGDGNGIDYSTARFERRLHPVKTSERITIDGRIDEPVWEKAAVADSFIQNEPDEGRPATEQTTIRVLYDRDNLYFAVSAKDSEEDHVIVTELRKDFTAENGDALIIALDTFHDERNAYQFAINPAGVKWDAEMSNEGRETNANWDGVWYVQARIVDDGWPAEIAIPFKTLKFPRTPVQTWGINFQRNTIGASNGVPHLSASPPQSQSYLLCHLPVGFKMIVRCAEDSRGKLLPQRADNWRARS